MPTSTGPGMSVDAKADGASSRAGASDAFMRPTIVAVIRQWSLEGRSGVVTCSALKRAYRRTIIGDDPAVRLVYLKGSRDLILRRMAARQGHFMPVALLDSQFAALEEPAPEEHAIVVPVDRTPAEIVAAIAEAVASR